MSRVTMLWYGGSSYAAPTMDDGEVFRSFKSAKDAFWSRADFDPHYPCVESPEAHVFIGPEVTDYPDYILTLGPRGGVRVERA